MNFCMKEQWRPVLIGFFLLAFVGLQMLGMAYKTPLGAPPDERAHLSYIHDAMQPGAWLPDYRAGEIYLMEENVNYLKHPALYYAALALVGRALDLDIYADVRIFRLVNVLMVLLGLALFIGFCRRISIGWFPTSVLLLSVAAIPMFSYHAGSVNNDNLIYAAVALVFYGLARGVDGGLPAFGWVAIGFVIAALTKVTAGAFLSFFLLFYLLLEWRRWAIFFHERAFWVSAIGAITVVVGYYLLTHWFYGSFLPSPRYLYTLTTPDTVISFTDYLAEFGRKMTERMAGIMSHLSFGPMINQVVPIFYAMLLTPVLAGVVIRFIPAWRSQSAGRLIFFDAILLGFLAVLALHVSLGYGAYSQTGALGGMQPRYYLYLMPWLFTAAFFLLRKPNFDALLAVPLAVLVLFSFWGFMPFAQERQMTVLAGQHSPLILDTDWRVESHTLKLRVRDKVVGHVDDFSLEDGIIYARGWAFEQSTNLPVNRILLTMGDVIVGSRPSNVIRPDVMAAMASRNAEQSGFSFFAFGVPKEVEFCEFSILVEFDDGSYGVLEAGVCSPWRSIQ